MAGHRLRQEAAQQQQMRKALETQAQPVHAEAERRRQNDRDRDRDSERDSDRDSHSEGARFDLRELSIGSQIGNGSFGTVYRGRWRGTDVAVKKLSCGAQAGALQAAEDFRSEIAMLGMLRHPNIVSSLAVFLFLPLPPSLSFSLIYVYIHAIGRCFFWVPSQNRPSCVLSVPRHIYITCVCALYWNLRMLNVCATY